MKSLRFLITGKREEFGKLSQKQRYFEISHIEAPIEKRGATPPISAE